MPSSSLPFRRRDPVAEATQALSFDDIMFPKIYEEAWGASNGNIADDRSEFDRARIFLLRMANMTPDPKIIDELRTIVANPQNKTIQALAMAIQHRIFGDSHGSFATTPLMQAVRFMLIKARVPELILSDRTRSVVDFFFDPTLERNLNAPPTGDVSVYKYPAGRLKVAIVGGGPTALASAIAIAEKGAGSVEVHMYEKRWVQKVLPNGSVIVAYPPSAKRRDQVVTLQDSVTRLLSKPSFQALFAGRPERVWPGSANIQIRKVEDRFLKRVQDPEFQGLIYLHCEGVTREDLAKVGDFHVLLGADGAASWVRQSYFQGYENERGRSYALGLAFDRPTGLPWSQPLNVFLTLGQTRYLLNASDHDGRGYLNMQLTEEEWHKMVSVDGQPVHFGRPGCFRKPDGSVPEGFEPSQIFAPSEDRGSPLWVSISDGLKLFGFKEEEVINVVRIPIVVQAVREGVQMLPPQDSINVKRPHALVAVAGDAAMTVHFWPGRGLNSGIKAGLALGDELVHALNNGKFIGMPIDALKEYNDFILKLQGREHDKRSIPILNQSGSPEMLGWLLQKANSVPDQVAIEWLIGAMTQIADRLQRRDDWAYDFVENVEPQLRIVLRQLDAVTLKEMAVSFPWPTREMAGAEVLPIRSMKAEEKQKWLNNLWGLLRDESKESRAPAPQERDRSPSAARFEAPKGGKARPVSLMPPSTNNVPNGVGTASLRRSNATQSVRHSRNLSVPGEGASRARSPSPGGEVSISRMLTVHKKPPTSVLGDALSLALFRVED
ncbi:hypothetical protein BBK36DRAFT_1122872 [Trichoderma citrinoviride]|uniref:FAD/NAD(P)-binding domain-containing protein n=1 Tax=Trichoderma citrinoviride TaxID=58853 RepID=A0A2T4B6I0_9HYPO|nr:hypothetical protein BBK36DRAFT_1122872 [Trichoderma citrinoviride]PTB64934.1 hypothetical protein BBK36DRAFT_1122872 [Trichoderma citrinoviride]